MSCSLSAGGPQRQRKQTTFPLWFGVAETGLQGRFCHHSVCRYKGKDGQMTLNIGIEQGTGTWMSFSRPHILFWSLYLWLPAPITLGHLTWISGSCWVTTRPEFKSPPYVIPTKYEKHFKETQIRYSTKPPSSTHHDEKLNLKCPMRLGKSWAQEQWLDRNAVPCQKPWGQGKERSMSNCHMLMEKLMSSQLLHKPTPDDPRGEQSWLWNVKVTEAQILTED